MSYRIGPNQLNSSRIIANDERLSPSWHQWAGAPLAQRRPWEEGVLWTSTRGIGFEGVGSLLGMDAATVGGGWAAIPEIGGGPDVYHTKIAWFGIEALMEGDVGRARVAWYGIEALSPLEDQLRVSWFGIDALYTSDQARARIAWFGIEVLMDGGVIVTPTPTIVADDGGTEMSAEFVDWPAGGVRVFFDLTGEGNLGDGSNLIACYSGVVGAGTLCVPVGDTLSWVAPPLPVGGPYWLFMITDDESFIASAQNLTVVRRSYTTNLYSLRSLFPPPRDVGAYALSDEEG